MNLSAFIRNMLRSFFFVGAGLIATSSSLRAEFSERTVEKAKQFTVRILAASDDRFGTGSGFVLNKQGHVVTNYHVIRGAGKVVVAYGRGTTVIMKEASVVASEPGKDIAILKCESLPQTVTATVAQRTSTNGQAVMALGFPGILDEMIAADGSSLTKTGRPDEFSISPEDAAGFEPVTFPGNVGKEMPIDSGFGGSFKAIAHNAKISEGNSGGPLIDINGRVAGINVQMAGTKLGAEYGFAIHASELVALARAHSIPIDVTSSKASTGGAMSGLQTLLFLTLAAFAVVLFLMVLRKPRTVMVDAMSRVIHSKKGKTREYPGPGPTGPGRPRPPSARTMRLRGRDMQGISYDLAFGPADFERGGGRLVIGRNNDLSQLVLSQDSISRQHATLLYRGGSVQVEDRNSGNGTRVNGRDLVVGQPAVTLSPGDKLTLGEIDLIFEILN